MIVFGCYSQIDTICIPKQRAIELINIENDLLRCMEVDSVRLLQIGNLTEQRDLSDEKVNDCLIAVDQLKRANVYATEQIALREENIEILEKEIKKGKLKNKLILIGSGIVEALTIYVLIR